MNKAYNKITWQNKPSTATPLNQTNLNEMSNALDTIDDRVIALDSGKVSSVTVTNTLPTGDTIATINVDGTATNIKSAQITVDNAISPTSTNPVQNKVIYEALQSVMPEVTVEGNPISITDGSDLVGAKQSEVTFLPKQDLHGYDNPWVGGAGKNKAPLTLTAMKANNTSGTWNGNVYTYGTVSITVETTDDDYITEISFSGSIASASSFVITDFSFPAGTYKFNGCSFGARLGTRITLQNISVTPAEELARVYGGSDVEFTLSQTTNVRATFIISTDLSSGKFYPMIRLSSVTDATFEPYSNICPISGWTELNLTVADAETSPTQTETYTETLGATYYGGEVDFVSGEGQNDYEFVTLTSVSGVSQSGGVYYAYTSGFHSFNNANVISSHFVKGSLALGKCYITGNGSTLVFVIPDQTLTTKAQYDAWLQNNNVQFAIPLATSSALTLTPTQIALLKGNNVISTDGDSIKLVYSADIKAWVESQLSNS